MKRNSLFLLASIFTIVISCKKDAKTIPNSSNNNSTVPTTQGYDAQIYAFNDMTLDGLNPSSTSVHAAIFYGSAVTNSPVPSVNAGTVSVNGVTLKMDNSNPQGPIYIDTTYAVPGNPFQLNVSGTTAFPAGTLQYGQNFPTFNDTSLIPSNVQLSTGLSIQFNSCMNADTVQFIIEDGNFQSITKKYVVLNNQVHLTVNPAELSAFTASNSGGITVDMVKNTTVAVGTKNYLVSLEKRYFKVFVQFN